MKGTARPAVVSAPYDVMARAGGQVLLLACTGCWMHLCGVG